MILQGQEKKRNKCVVGVNIQVGNSILFTQSISPTEPFFVVIDMLPWYSLTLNFYTVFISSQILVLVVTWTHLSCWRKRNASYDSVSSQLPWPELSVTMAWGVSPHLSIEAQRGKLCWDHFCSLFLKGTYDGVWLILPRQSFSITASCWDHAEPFKSISEK